MRAQECTRWRHKIVDTSNASVTVVFAVVVAVVVVVAVDSSC